MKNIEVPKRENISEENKFLFKNIEKIVGFVPNMYATLAHSPTALDDYLKLQNRKSSLNIREKEAINLIVSQVNNCNYCIAAHNATGKMIGYTEEELMEIRMNAISFDQKLDTLVHFAKEVTSKKGEIPEALKIKFFADGYSEENLVDVIMLIGEKTITNYLFALAKVPIDFPLAPAI